MLFAFTFGVLFIKFKDNISNDLISGKSTKVSQVGLLITGLSDRADLWQNLE